MKKKSPKIGSGDFNEELRRVYFLEWIIVLVFLVYNFNIEVSARGVMLLPQGPPFLYTVKIPEDRLRGFLMWGI